MATTNDKSVAQAQAPTLGVESYERTVGSEDGPVARTMWMVVVCFGELTPGYDHLAVWVEEFFFRQEAEEFARELGGMGVVYQECASDPRWRVSTKMSYARM